MEQNTPQVPPHQQPEVVPAETIVTPPTDSEKKSNLKKVLLSVVAVVILAAAAGYWLTRKSEPVEPTASVGHLQQKITKSDYTLLYAVSKYLPGGSNCQNSSTKVYSQQSGGGTLTELTSLPSNTGISDSGVLDSKIYFITNSYCDSKSGPTVFFSSDTGESFSKLYEAPAATGQDTLGSQITSSLFSRDGLSILIANLPSDSSSNTVQEIDTKSKQIKDLFTVSSRGVFMVGYDKDKGDVYYYKGCYNCDGNAYDKLYRYSLVSKSEKIIYQNEDTINDATLLNDDFTKAIISQSTPGDYLGGGPPFYIKELNLVTGQLKKLTTINEEIYHYINRDPSGNLTYVVGKKIMKLNVDGSSTELLTADSEIRKVDFISDQKVIYEAGDYPKSGADKYQVFIYDRSKKTATKLHDLDDKTWLIAVIKN